MEEDKKATHFANVEDLISSCKDWIYEEDRDAFYRWFEFGAMEDLINLIERLQKEFETVDHECSRLEQKEIELEKENGKYRLEIIPRLEGDIQAYKQRIDELKKESEDWRKAYQEEKDEQFNMLTKKCSLCDKNALNFEKTVHTCLHCGENTPLYCETCYQELISKNAELQTMLQNRIIRK